MGSGLQCPRFWQNLAAWSDWLDGTGLDSTRSFHFLGGFTFWTHCILNQRCQIIEQVAGRITDQGGRALAIQADVTDRAAVKRMADQVFTKAVFLMVG